MSKFTGLIDSIYKKIHQKEFLIPGIVIILFLTFKEPLESLASTTIVKYALSKVPSESYIDVIFFIVASYIVFLAIVKTSKRYVASSSITIWMLIISMVYFHYRVIQDPPVWEFTELHYMPFFKYADLVFIGIFFQVLVSITYHLKHNSKSFYKEKQNPEEDKYTTFIEDCSLGEDGDDFLGYSDYANELGNKILATNFKEAFAIGVNGKWGSGKTSFIDLLKRRTNGHDLIEVDFNPWNSHTENAIIKDFFETLQDEISPHHSSIARKLVRYSDKLIELNSNTVTQSISAVIRGFAGFESTEKLHSEVNKALKKIDKKIVVYIDDLDRLDKNEVIEVIRLIRNTANFYNTVFVVAYDRSYVINSLDKFNKYNKEYFLEKIFQIEINLPKYDVRVLRMQLAKNLKYKLPATYHEVIETEIMGPLKATSYTAEILESWLESVRDVTRLTNSILLNSSRLLGEIILSDLIIIEVLRLKYPNIYELIRKYPSRFLDNSEVHSFNKHNYYQLKKLNNINQPKYIIEEVLSDEVEYEIENKNIEKIINLLEKLFSSKPFYYDNSKVYLSVVFPSNFNRYFSYDMMKGEISEVEFGDARRTSLLKLKELINTWIEGGLELNARVKFEQVKDFDSREDFENIIESIFYFGSYKLDKPSVFGRKYIGYGYDDLYSKMDNYENRIIGKYYNENKGENDYKQFIVALFNSSSPPYLFEAGFINYLNERLKVDLPLTRDELLGININYLKKYIDHAKEFDSNIVSLYYNCSYKEWVPYGSNSYKSTDLIPNEAKCIVRSFIEKGDLDGFLKSVIRSKPFDDLYMIDKGAMELYGGWDQFERMLYNKNNNNHKYLAEFIEFYELFKSKSYTKYVKFEFNKIPIG